MTLVDIYIENISFFFEYILHWNILHKSIGVACNVGPDKHIMLTGPIS